MFFIVSGEVEIYKSKVGKVACLHHLVQLHISKQKLSVGYSYKGSVGTAHRLGSIEALSQARECTPLTQSRHPRFPVVRTVDLQHYLQADGQLWM
eukprot:1843604-Pyramimonas_sp.AAC.1